GLWDLWGKVEGKPVWKLLADMTPEQLVRCLDLRHVTDALTPAEALAILERNAPTKAEREREMLALGYPAYTTSAGWLGYSDEVLGHARVAEAVRPLGIGVATGEHCQNRILFKQLFQARAIDFCQIDACRLGGVNEVLAVLLMAANFGVPVCPHAGGVGLCELVQHLSLFDYVAVSADLTDRVVEYVDHLHEHFLHPVTVRNARYMPPEAPGHSAEMKPASLERHRFPDGAAWIASRS